MSNLTKDEKVKKYEEMIEKRNEYGKKARIKQQIWRRKAEVELTKLGIVIKVSDDELKKEMSK